MLKSSIPMKTWQEWNDTEPGSCRSTWSATRAATTTARSSTPSTRPTSPPAGPRRSRCAPKGEDRRRRPGRTAAAVPVPHRRASTPTTGQRVHQPPPRPLVPDPADHLHPRPIQPQERPGPRRAEELDRGAPQRRLLPLRHPRRTRPAQPAVAAGLAAGEPVPAPAEAPRPRPAPARSSARRYDTADHPAAATAGPTTPTCVDPHDRQRLDRPCCTTPTCSPSATRSPTSKAT